MIPFAANIAAETVNAFEWTGQPQKLPFPLWGSWLPSNAWFFGPTRVSPQTASRLVQPLLQDSWTWLIHRERPRYYVCMRWRQMPEIASNAIGWQWRNFFIPIYASCSAREDVGQGNVNILQHLQSDRRSGARNKLTDSIKQHKNGSWQNLS